MDGGLLTICAVAALGWIGLSCLIATFFARLIRFADGQRDNAGPQ